MPIVTIQITREGATSEQKAALIKGATELLADVLDKPPGLTFVVIQEVEMDDWGVGGLPVGEYRRQAEATRRVDRLMRREQPGERSEMARLGRGLFSRLLVAIH